MQDHFTGKPTCIRGPVLPSAAEMAAIQSDHRRRLAALARLSTAAARVGVGTDPDDDLILWEDDELSLLAGADEIWSEFAGAVHSFRELTPIVPLESFGFDPESEDPLANNDKLRLVGGGVEAWAFVAGDGSIYKFYLPREGGRIVHSFRFTRGDEAYIDADAVLGSYKSVFEKLYVINALGGLPTEVVGVSREGVVIAKQTQGRKLAEGTNVIPYIPNGFIALPSRFLKANRDQPRLFFLAGEPWFVADFHEKNMAFDVNGSPRVIDILVAPWPTHLSSQEPAIHDWLERARLDPNAPVLVPRPDHEL